MLAIGLGFAFALAALQPAIPGPAVGDSAASAPAPKPAPAPAPGAGDTARAPYIGRWTDTGDCTAVTVLDADGSFTAPDGGRGLWEVQGSTLTIWGPGGSYSWDVDLSDPNRLTLTSPDGSQTQSTRC